MTFEEAKEILDNEKCFCIEKVAKEEPKRKVTVPSWEKLCVREAIIALGKLGYQVFYNLNYPAYRYREDLLKGKGIRPDCEKENEIVDELIEKDGASGVGMTLDEAKERLIEKGYSLKKTTNVHPSQADCFTDKVLKCAVATVNANGYMVSYHDTVKVTTQEYIDAAKEFNDSLLDEQAKKIKEQKKQIKHLNKIIASRNKEIWDLKDRLKEMKDQSNEIARLHKIIGGKEDLLNKYRISDFNKEQLIAGLRKDLAKETVNKVDAQALKSAESALVYKDKVIFRLKEKIGETEVKNSKLESENESLRRALHIQNAIIGKLNEDAHTKEIKTCNKEKLFTGVDLGSDEGDKTYVGFFDIYNEVPIGTEPLTEEYLIKFAEHLFRKTR